MTQARSGGTPATAAQVDGLGMGPVARSIADFEWSATALGARASWPVTLSGAVLTLSHAPVAMALLYGPTGALIYNDGYAAILGDKPPALGESVLEVWPEAREFNAAVIERALRGEASEFKNQRFKLDRGAGPRDSWFDLYYAPLMDHSGVSLGALAIVIETTEQVRRSAEAAAERERFAELFEQAPTFMAVLRGPEHRFEMANPGYMALVGDRELVGRTVAEAVPEAGPQGFTALLDEVYRSGKAFRGSQLPIEMQRTPGGPAELHYLDFVYQPIRDPEGAVSGIFVEGFDVTERVAAERETLALGARHKKILDSAIDYAIIATDLQGRITEWNKGAFRVLGWTAKEMLGQSAERFFTPEDRAGGRIEQEMAMALATGMASDERWHLRRSGERFWASGELTPLLGEDGMAVGFVKVLRDRTEQHATAERLRQSEARLRRAQQAGGVGAFTLDVNTNRIHGTAEFYRLFGLDDADSYPAETLEALVDPAYAQTAARPGIALEAEFPIVRASDGQRRWISRKAEWTAAGDGAGLRMDGVAQDVTEQRRARDAADESAAQFRLLAESLPNQVWTASADGSLDWFNRRVYEYSGADVGALDGAGWAQLLHPDDAQAAAARWTQSLVDGSVYEIEFRIRRHDGAYRWHLVRALPIAGSGGVSRWIGTNTDIHEGRLALAESARDRDRIWTLSQELMLVADFAGVIEDVNPAATRLLGWSRAAMVGESLAQFVHPDDIERTGAEVGKLAGGITTMAFENRYRSTDGSYRLLSWTAVPDGGRIHAVARDVTRERAAEDALRQSEKLKAIGQLTGGVAHDFNNMLGIIKMSMDILALLPAGDARGARATRAIGNAVEQATKLTGQLLSFARQQNLQPTVFDAGAKARAVGEMMSSVAGARVQLELLLAPQACYVMADPTQFATALVNLAVNARDAMPQGGKLVMQVRPAEGIPAQNGEPAVAGSFVAVSVSDTGLGIAPDQLAHIFEPFFTTKPVGAGTGLGLSQVFGFAKQSGGDIRVQSRPGEGAKFTLYLPRAAADAVQTADLDPPHPRSGRPGSRVLVVEDNLDLAAAVEMMLGELGYEPTVVSSGERALAALRDANGGFDALFSDVVMPGIGGLELGRRVRQLYPQLPVLLASGYSEELSQAREQRFPLLAKPYSLADLAQALARVVKDGPG